MQEEDKMNEAVEEEFQESADPEISEASDDVTPQPPADEDADQPRRLRRFLIWTVGLLILFALGVVAAWFLQIQPMRDENRAMRTELAAANESVDALTSEVEMLRPLEAENEALAERVAELESHIFLLDVLVDVSKAQLALVEENPIAAEDALQGTAERLQQLEERLSGADADTVRGMSERLTLAIEEVETDEFAARRDLEIIANNLIALEQRLFSE